MPPYYCFVGAGVVRPPFAATACKYAWYNIFFAVSRGLAIICGGGDRTVETEVVDACAAGIMVDKIGGSIMFGVKDERMGPIAVLLSVTTGNDDDGGLEMAL